MGKFEGVCFSCTNAQLSLDFTSSLYNGSREKITCSRYGWVGPYETCRNYSNAYRSDDYLDRCYSAYLKKCHWYVLSTISKILCLPEEIDNKFIIMKSYLYQTNEGRLDISEYEINGLKVANKILDDYNNADTREQTFEYLKNVYDNCLVIVLEQINLGNFKSACEYYFEIISMMMEKYGIKYEPIICDVKENNVVRSRTLNKSIEI